MVLSLNAFFYAGTSGIWQSSSGFLPQTLHSPSLFLIIGLLVAQVPLNSLPVTIYLMLISINEMPKTQNIINSVYKNWLIDS